MLGLDRLWIFILYSEVLERRFSMFSDQQAPETSVTLASCSSPFQRRQSTLPWPQTHHNTFQQRPGTQPMMRGQGYDTCTATQVGSKQNLDMTNSSQGEVCSGSLQSGRRVEAHTAGGVRDEASALASKSSHCRWRPVRKQPLPESRRVSRWHRGLHVHLLGGIRRQKL